MVRFVSFICLLCSVLLSSAPGCAAEFKEHEGITRLGYTIRAGTLSNITNAEELVAKLQKKNIDAFYFKNENGIYTVRFGNFSSLEEALKVARQLVADKIINDDYFIAYPHGSTNIKQKQLKQLETDRAARYKREVKRMEKVLKSKQFSVKFYSECFFSNEPVEHVVCNMIFPEKLYNMRYAHEIEALTMDIALSFARNKSDVSFEIYALMKGRGDKEAALSVKQSQVKGNFIPVCAYEYSKEFDSLQSIWPSP